ncbi:glycosyltransferase family 4 protein [Candidatus Gottesmanbacteria bacterium]|nr:glycosyltransferase family 4 protein [Candidatus Gottesmanbacteria bacterium]
MKIAQVAPPWLPVPPKGYGGIEAVVSSLTDGLVSRGHDVTLFATGDSVTEAKLSFVYEKALGNDGSLKNNPYTQLFQIYPVFSHCDQFDIIHIHGEGQAMFFADLIKTPLVHTIHGTLTEGEQNPDKRKVYQQFAKQNFVSISNAQRTGLPELNYVATVYNGIDLSQFTVGDGGGGLAHRRPGEGGYLAWLGRITPKKGVVEAIHVAKAVGVPLRLAAFIDPVDQAFFDTEIKPLIDGSSVQFVGQLNHQERSLFLQKAKAFVFPIKWEEPFGLVMVEAMAAGTPVVAFNRGSVPEIIMDGKTGYVVADVDSMAEALKRLLSLDAPTYQAMRQACRKHVEDHFTVEKMVEGYEAVYKKLTSI